MLVDFLFELRARKLPCLIGEGRDHPPRVSPALRPSAAAYRVAETNRGCRRTHFACPATPGLDRLGVPGHDSIVLDDCDM